MSASDWYNNSLVDLNNKSEFNDTLAIVAMVITSLLLVHSVYLHGGKPKTVRVFADVCSLCGLATGVACYISNQIMTQKAIAIGVDLISYGICNTIIALVDSMMTYTRYRLLIDPKSYFKYNIFVSIYLFLFIFVSNFPFYSIVPLFIDTNVGVGLEALNIGLYYIYAPAFAFFNMAFSWVFLSKAIGFKSNRIEGHPKLLELAYKSSIHSVISIAMNCLIAVMAVINPVRAQLFYSVIIPVTLHCLFNWHGEWKYYAARKVDIADKLAEINDHFKDRSKSRVAPYSNELVVSHDIHRQGTSSSGSAKYGIDFLKPINLVEECCKAIDEMEAAARTVAVSSPPRKSLRSAMSILASGRLKFPIGQNKVSAKDNSLFILDQSNDEGSDTVLRFALEEGFF